MNSLMTRWAVGFSGPPTYCKQSNLEGLREATRRGFSLYESVHGRTDRVADKTLATMKEEATAAGVRLTVHGLYFTVVLSNPDQPLEKSIDFISRSIAIGEKLGGVPVVIHPGAKYRPNRDKQKWLVINRLSEVLLSGVNPDLVYLESMGKVDSFGNIIELLDIARVLGVRIVVDWAHEYAKLCAQGYSLTRKYIRWVIKELEYFPWARTDSHHHISGMEVNAGGESKHLSIFTNTTPWELVLEELYSSRLGGTIIFESDRDDLTPEMLYLQEPVAHD